MNHSSREGQSCRVVIYKVLEAFTCPSNGERGLWTVIIIDVYPLGRIYLIVKEELHQIYLPSMHQTNKEKKKKKRKKRKRKTNAKVE